MTPEELKAERAALEAAIAERQRHIDKAKTLAWCETRKGANMNTDLETPEEIAASLAKREEMFVAWAKSREAGNTVTKSAPATRVEQMFTSEGRSIIAATGELMGKERKSVAEEHAKMRAEFKAALELEIAKLRAEWLQSELDKERGTKRPSVMPFGKSA